MPVRSLAILLRYLWQAWPRWLLLLSLGFFAFHFLPAAYLEDFSADLLIPSTFYHELVVQGYPLSGMAWGGAPFLFPDLAGDFLLNFLLRDGVLALQVASALIFLAWLFGWLLVYYAAGGRKLDTFAALAAILGVALACHSFISDSLSREMFLSCFHSGAMLLTIGGLALTLRLWFGRHSPWSLCVLAVGTFLGSVSDLIFIVTFCLPMAATLLLLACLHPARVRTALNLAALILGSAALGHLLTPWLFPIPLASGYTSLNPDRIFSGLTALYDSLSLRNQPGYVVLTLLDIAVVILCVVHVFKHLRAGNFSTPTSSSTFLLIFTGSLILANWLALILTGNYTEIFCIRYLICSLTFPLMLAAMWIAQALPKFQYSGTTLPFLATCFALGAGMAAPVPQGHYQEISSALPVLKAVMQQEGETAALADYWYSSPLAYFSGYSLGMGMITGEGHVNRWFSNIRSYAEPDSPQKWRSFRIIAMAHMDERLIAGRFGPPARIIPTPGGFDLWVYKPEDALRFTPFFHDLGNRRSFPAPNQFHIAAAHLPSQTGQADGDTLIARAGVDKENCLTFGPYLHAIPGRYRVDITYDYEALPAPGREATFDATYNTPSGERRLAQGSLPHEKNGPQRFSYEIILPQESFSPDRATLETRTFYRGSGTIRISALDITCLNAGSDHP